MGSGHTCGCSDKGDDSTSEHNLVSQRAYLCCRQEEDREERRDNAIDELKEPEEEAQKQPANLRQDSAPLKKVAPRSEAELTKTMVHANNGQTSRSVLKVKQGGFALKNFCPSNPCKLDDFFVLEKETIGEGGYGAVRKGKDKRTGIVMAVKSIVKDAATDATTATRLDREIEIMQLVDHPNIIRLRESFADFQQIHLVLDLCPGGDLLNCISEATIFNEHLAGRLIRQMFLAVNYLHHNHIVHRDIKPENWLLATKDDISNCTLKLIDFGFSRRFSPEVKLKSRVGTPYYIAPEVIEGCYDEKADVWSLGVIAHLLLSGGLPFMARATSEILDMVQHHAVKLSGKRWDKVSEDAKAMVNSCLRRDSLKRPTAQEALRDTWVAAALADKRHRTLSPLDVHNFKAYSNMHKVKKATLTVIATQLTEPNIIQLKKTFMSMDKNCDGTLSMKEVREGMLKSGVSLPENFNQLVDDVDNDGSGAIDYTEFLAATLDRKQYYQRDVLWNAFRKFDIDGSGTIEKKELMHILGNQEVQDVMNMHMQELSRLFDEIDSNKDGIIDFDEFFKMMQGSGGSLEFQ